MELIIKPTSLCNFNCSFCAASEFNCDHLRRVPEDLKKAIKLCKPSNIIFTGGEPTMVPPDFYRDLLYEFPDIVIDITSNLHGMMRNADEWCDILSNKMFKVTTSFNYNGKRIIKTAPYSERMFCRDMKDFKSITSYTPNFIAVLDENDSYDMAKKYCELAKKLNTFCRINGANPIGREKHGVPRWKMLKIYMRLIDDGLGDYEINCLERSSGKCPINSSFKCQEEIRAIYFKDSVLYWSDCEEKINMNIDIHKGLNDINKKSSNYKAMKNECLLCPMYRICNACYVNAKFMTDKDCIEMKKISKEVEKYGWKM